MRWWQLKKRDGDLERELQSDLELEEEEQRESGQSQEDARYAAQRAFGNVSLIREQTRETWGWMRMETFRPRRSIRVAAIRQKLGLHYDLHSSHWRLELAPPPPSSASWIRCCCAHCSIPMRRALSESG